MKLRKMISTVLVSSMLLTGLAACGSESKPATKGSSTEAAQTAKKETLKPATLKILIPGDKSATYDQVQDAITKKLTEDGLNCKLDITYVPWSDYKNKLQVSMTAGEDYDLLLDAPWNLQAQMAKSGHYEDLEPLLNKYGPNILANRPKEMWDANKIFGKIYGIPSGQTFFASRGLYIRKDLREKLGIAPIKTWEDLDKFLLAVRDKESSITPFDAKSLELPYHMIFMDADSQIKMVQESWGLILYFKKNDGKVRNMFDEQDPTIWSAFTKVRKYYTDKIMNQDVLATKSNRDLFFAGKLAATTANSWNVSDADKDRLTKAVPGATMELVTFVDTTKKYLSTFVQSNFAHIPVYSKNKERTIMFLDWVGKSQDNYDLVTLGVKGINWELAGEASKVISDKKYDGSSWAFYQNPKQGRPAADTSPEAKKLTDWTKVAGNFTLDKTSGFTFDQTPVASEVAQLTALNAQYMVAINNGAVDLDKTWAEYKSKAADSVKKIQTEYQKQLDAFLSGKK